METIVPRIIEKIQYLQDKENLSTLNGDDLTRAEIEIATLSANLHELLSFAEADYSKAKRAVEFQRATKIIDIKSEFDNKGQKHTISFLEALAEVAIKKYKESEIEALRKYKSLLYLIQQIPLVLNAIKDRIKILMHEEIQTR